MDKPKARVFVAVFAYGGNGGIAAVSPDLMMWWAKCYHDIKQNPLIDFAGAKVFSDTPITMTRNEAVETAKALKADMILMLDSDNIPDGYLGRYSTVKPFFPTAFDFSYDRLLKGIPTVIAAPYCGPPPPPVDQPGVEHLGEVPYLFEWANLESDCPEGKKKLAMLTRNEASRLAGIYPVAALPTGVCLFTLNAFEGLKQPYFRYEMNESGSAKKSTEDVVATRDISLFWKITKGYDVLFAACDCWALHVKTKKVGRPQYVPIESISEDFADAIRRNWSAGDEIRHVDFTQGLPKDFPKESVVWIDEPAKPAGEAPTSAGAKCTKTDETKLGYKLHGPIDPEAPPPPTDIRDIPGRWGTLGPNDNYVRISQADWEAAEKEAHARGATAVADPEEPTDIDEPEPETHKSNGHGLRHKMVGQRKVAILDHEMSDEEVENLQAVTNWLVGKLEGGIDVAVVHPGTGQGTAAIVSCLPGMSRILAFDSTSQYGSEEYAKHFKLTFEKELETGLVKADVDGKQFPDVRNYKADMVFIENFVTKGKLETWKKAISPRGILCGTGFSKPDIAKIVEDFRNKHELPVQASGDFWVIPIGGIANAKQ